MAAIGRAIRNTDAWKATYQVRVDIEPDPQQTALVRMVPVITTLGVMIPEPDQLTPGEIDRRVGELTAQMRRGEGPAGRLPIWMINAMSTEVALLEAWTRMHRTDQLSIDAVLPSIELTGSAAPAAGRRSISGSSGRDRTGRRW